MSNSTSWRTALCLALVMTAAPASGAAQGTGFSRGLRLGLAADLVSFRQDTTSTPPIPMVTTGSRSTTETTGYGVLVPRVGIDVAGFFLPFLGVGIRAAVTATDTSIPGASGSFNVLSYRLTAYGEGRFVFTRLLALQVRAELGFAGTSSGSSFGGMSGSNTTTTSFTGGAQIGLHIYPVDAFSITPYFGLSGSTGGGNSTSPSGVGVPTVTPLNVEGFDVALGVALFGWIDLDGDDEASPVSGSDFRREAGDDGTAAATPAAAAYTAPAEPTGPSTEPVASGADWFVEFEVPGAQARAWANPVTSVVLLELRTSSEAPRFEGCTEAVITAGAATAPMVVSVTPTRTLSAVEEQILMSATPEHLDILRADGARIELCGFTIELSTRARYALGRLRDRQRTPTAP